MSESDVRQPLAGDGGAPSAEAQRAADQALAEQIAAGRGEDAVPLAGDGGAPDAEAQRAADAALREATAPQAPAEPQAPQTPPQAPQTPPQAARPDLTTGSPAATSQPGPGSTDGSE